MELKCAICKKPVDRYHAVRIGGIVEQLTHERFACRVCVNKVIHEKLVFVPGRV